MVILVGFEDKERYIHSFRKSEGIELDNASINYNSEKRGLAEFCLNSMWGKLSQGNNRKMTKLISDPKELDRFLATPGIEVINRVSSGFHVSLQLYNVCQVYVMRMRLSVLTSPQVRKYICIGISIDSKRRQFIVTDSVIIIQPRDEHQLVESRDKL